MAIFNSYVSLPEGRSDFRLQNPGFFGSLELHVASGGMVGEATKTAQHHTLGLRCK